MNAPSLLHHALEGGCNGDDTGSEILLCHCQKSASFIMRCHAVNFQGYSQDTEYGAVFKPADVEVVLDNCSRNVPYFRTRISRRSYGANKMMMPSTLLPASSLTNDNNLLPLPRNSDVLVHGSVEELVHAALSDSSRSAYQADLKQFTAWGGSVPCTPETIARYLAAHAGIHAVATLCRRLVSIGKAHTSQNLPSPTASDLVKAVLKGIRRTHGAAQKQAAPAIKEDVLAMVNGLTGIKGIRDRALLLVGFAGAFRRSELVSLTVEDVQFDKRGLLIHLIRSKTDQEGRGRKIAIPYARGAVCAVHALQAWLEASGISAGLIFRGVTRHELISEVGLTPQSVALVIKERASAVGLDPNKYSGHSLRAGLVTSAAQMGVSSWKIRQQTGHKSDAMLYRYIRDANVFTDNAAGAVL